MTVLNRMMSYDKTKIENQEKCNCAECVENADISKNREIIGNFNYADDFLISSRYEFDYREIERYVMGTLAEFGAPFTINVSKTRYGSSAGSNWNLGVMLNKDNQITVGYKKKRQFQAMLHSFILDTANGAPWTLEDTQVLEGYRNYYRMVEKETIDNIVKHINEKHGVDVVQMIKQRMRAG